MVLEAALICDFCSQIASFKCPMCNRDACRDHEACIGIHFYIGWCASGDMKTRMVVCSGCSKKIETLSFTTLGDTQITWGSRFAAEVLKTLVEDVKTREVFRGKERVDFYKRDIGEVKKQ